jgi:predicted NBD/HSP70 family sugar kinase
MPLSNRDVKRHNRVNLYRAVLREESVSRNDLASRLGLSLPTVAQNLKELQDMGLIKEVGTLASTGGRKAAVLAPLPDARLSLGVDITRNHISLAAVNLAGETRRHLRAPLRFQNDEAYFATAAERAEGFIRDMDPGRDKLIGVGISFPGIVSGDGSALLGSHILNLGGPLALRLPLGREVPFRLFNDASAACLAELRKEGEGAGNFFFLSLSNSVGGALVIDGKIFPGENQRCGEVGHMCVDPKGLACYCGGAGHYDTYGSALRLATPAGGRLEDFFQGLEDGNEEYRGIFEGYLGMLALMVANLRMCFDCDIVLGGYVGGFLGPYVERLRGLVAGLDSFHGDTGYLRRCSYKMEGAAVGAALHFIDRFIDEA